MEHRSELLGGSLTSASVVRRLGSTPEERGSGANVGSCPDVLELSTGDFAVIGIEATDMLRDKLPSDAGVADYERLVVLPRAVLLAARSDIPEA